MKDEGLSGGLIAELSVAYALRVIRLFRALEQDGAGRVLGRQLLRSGTAIGANVQEAQGAQSRADFIAKMSIAHKEARESAYWLLLARDGGLLPADRLAGIIEETDRIIRVITSILITAKEGKRAV
jgi:four helix bundle protein